MRVINPPANLITIPRNAYDYSTWTADTPTNITETLLTGANGPTIRLASATATIRGGGRYTTGTRITAASRSRASGTAGSTKAGAAIYLCRPGTDNRRLLATFGAGTSFTERSVYLLLLTDKDTFTATRLSLLIHADAAPALRLGSRAGTTSLEISQDGGVNWTSIYSAADATAFGTAGAGTHAGVGGYTENATASVESYLPYALVEA